MNSDIFAERSKHTQITLARLTSELTQRLDEHLNRLIGDHTCIYATGSCGRMEMGQYSDLDAYIVRVDGSIDDADAAVLEAAIAVVNANLGLPALDAGGHHLEPVEGHKLLDLLGSPRDDSQGVLTKRMLLMLESRVILGPTAHQALIDKVIDAYWQNQDLHPTDYLPFVLVNDIIRYWRIVLLNHESRLRKKRDEMQSHDFSPAELDARMLAERRHRSYKLRLPRCLTCFSALAYLLALTPDEPANVSKADIRTLVSLSPVDRLRRLPHSVEPQVTELLRLYADYLTRTNDHDKGTLLDKLQHDSEFQRAVSLDGGAFTKLMFELISQLGGGRPLHRHMLV